MNDQKTMYDLTPDKLSNYATNILVCKCPIIITTDYAPDPIDQIGKWTNKDCEEIVRYANHLAKKEGFGNNYFNPERAKKNLPVFTDKKDKKSSDLEKKVTVGSAAAA